MNFLKLLWDEIKPKRRWIRYGMLGLTILAAIYLVFMGVDYVTSRPDFCKMCHEMKSYVTSWSNKPHKSVNCRYCHEQRGFLGKLDLKARALNDVHLHFTGQYSVIFKAKVFEHNCASCHLGKYRNYPNTVRLDKRHYKYIKEHRSCIKCHKEPGHNLSLFSENRFE